MLAQNFKTAAELGISEAEASALITVLGMLDRGEIGDSNFDLGRFWSYADGDDDCGTIGCLCGWASFVSAGAAFPEIQEPGTSNATRERRLQERLNHDLVTLFGLNAAAYRGGKPNREQATAALRNYLSHGEPRWNDVKSCAP